MALSTERKGETYILASVLLWGFFPIITVLSYHSTTPLVSLGISTFFSSLLFGSAILLQKRGKEIKDKIAFKDILLATAIVGILFYVLYYFGLKYTTVGNASIIALTEVFFSYIFYNIWREEYISTKHIAGALLMLTGAIIVLASNFTHFHPGDLLIISAAFVAPLGNFFQRRARERISSQTIMFTRSIIAAPVIIFIAYVSGEKIVLNQIKESIALLLINGFILLGISKIFWLEGIKYINVAKANAMFSLSTLFTLLFGWIILHESPTSWQVVAFMPMVCGVILLSTNTRQRAQVAKSGL